mgnify:CR=1 FL=1
MTKNILFPLTIIFLAYGFWVSPNFKEISAGIAIFLFGMLSLEQGFKNFSGGALNKVLSNSTDRLYKSIGFGILSTSIMQSSSLVSVLTISFLGAGLLTLTQGIGVIFGANLGTTTGAWLVAGYGLKIDIGAYAMPMLVFGILSIFQKNSSLKGIGYILMGLGFLFLGIHYMKEGFEAFKETINLSEYAVGGIKGLLLFTLIGIFATVVMQSSHATLVLIITALGAGQISYENALALAIGANVGTTITAILGAMSSNIEGKRLAAAHLVFNGVTGAIAIIFIHQIVLLVDMSAVYLGVEEKNYTLKLAIFHTIFNTIGILVMVPLIPKLVLFLEKRLQVKDSTDEIGHEGTLYLNDSVLEFPQSSMEAIIKETKHLYDNAFEIIAHGLNLKRSKIASTMELEEVIKISFSKKAVDIEELYEKKIKDIYSELITFSTRAQINMPSKSIEELYKIKLASRDIVEAVKNTKHLQKNMLKFAAHPNQQIKKEYANIKLSLAELLRNINIIATTDEDDVILLLLSKIRINTQKNDILSNGRLDELIRTKQITNQMATSLMNDSVYVYNIRSKLSNVAEALFIEANSDLKLLEEEMKITQSEVETLLEKEE